MRQTRRGFVGSAVALGAAAMWTSGAGAQAAPVRISLADFSKDPARVASLRKGVGVMKARAPSDHGSWFFQAAIHAYNDAAYAAALQSDPKVAEVDGTRFWNKCPHFGQSSADFLIWHRAYLFNFERILRDAAGDPSLALPYWDYSKPEMRGFPEIFAIPYVDDAGTIANPLYHPNREQAFVTGRFELSDPVCEATDTMAAPVFFSDVGVAGFAGDTLDSEHTQLGLIEQRPHNDIHIAVGGIVGTANGAMADVPTAAFDPVFWVHHANIDRLWILWSSTPGKSWGPIPVADWLDDEPWEFIDVDGTVKKASRRFFIDRHNIPVSYDTDAQNGPPLVLPPAPVLAAPPPPPPPPTGAAPGGENEKAAPPQQPIASHPTDHELVADATPLNLAPSRPVARALPQFAPMLTGTITGRTLRAAAKRVLLELSDISFARVPSSGFAVYLASPSDVAAGRTGRFVGLLDLFGSTHGHMSGMTAMGAVQRFDVTRIVAQEGMTLTLRVEPYDLFVSKAGGTAPARADEVRIGKVRFLEVT